MEVVVHYPTTREKQLELEKRVALVHADAVIQRIKNLSCPKEQKIKLYQEIKKAYCDS